MDFTNPISKEFLSNTNIGYNDLIKLLERVSESYDILLPAYQGEDKKYFDLLHDNVKNSIKTLTAVVKVYEEVINLLEE